MPTFGDVTNEAEIQKIVNFQESPVTKYAKKNQNEAQKFL